MTLQAITANRLSDGLVVYLSQRGGWSERLDDALTTSDRDDAARLLRQAEGAVARDVVGPYLIDLNLIDLTGGGESLRPARRREAIRAQGPTVETATAQTRESL